MPPVSPLSKIWGRLPRQLNGAGAYTYLLTYLLTYLVGARAKVHSFVQKTAVAVATIRQ